MGLIIPNPKKNIENEPKNKLSKMNKKYVRVKPIITCNFY